jgi:glycosyltransferase involved in cell wall biosynthesis
LKIGFLADKIPYPARRGWGVYSFHLLKALLSIDHGNEYRCFYSIFRSGSRGLVVKAPGARLINRIWPLPGRIMDRLWETWNLLPAEFFTGKVDVLHVPYEFLPKTAHARTVVTVHDVTFLKHPELLDPGFVRLYSNRLENICRRADRIITVSENTKKDLLEFYPLPSGRITVVHEGVDPVFRPAATQNEINRVRKKFGISGPYILFVGAADEDKNLVRLAEAFSRVREKTGDIQLVLAGKNEWGYNGLKAKLESLHLLRGLVFTGFVPADDLPVLYSGASAFALPSIHEGFGLPALEAMACGVPVLCSRTGSLPEVTGPAALLVDPLNTEEIARGLQTILTDETLRQTYIKQGLERSEKFSWANTARQVLDLYRDLHHEK